MRTELAGAGRSPGSTGPQTEAVAEPGRLPYVSVIVPCRNEARFIGRCLDSIIGNGYPLDRLEVLVVDGMSDDGTREILDAYASRHPFVRRLDNPRRITPVALNIAVGAARGEVIIRMDAHAEIGERYIQRSVDALSSYAADNVGGIRRTLPQSEGLLGTAVAACHSHVFGAGNSHFRLESDRVRPVDTVFGGCYRRDVFARVGLFNERLVRTQDMEFNLRLLKAGGRILLVPDIVCTYYARCDWRSFWAHNWGNGVWAVLPFAYSRVMPVAWRHLVPLAFVSSLLGAAAATLVWPPAVWLLSGLCGAYGVASFGAALQIAWRKRVVRLIPLMPVVFGSLHLAYGLGSLWGVLLAVTKKAGGFWSSRRAARREAGRC